VKLLRVRHVTRERSAIQCRRSYAVFLLTLEDYLKAVLCLLLLPQQTLATNWTIIDLNAIH
jgi:hypothetical protein